MELAIMIEGQNGLTWQKLERIASAVEALGYAALYRSDHITNSCSPDQPSLDCWVSLAWLAPTPAASNLVLWYLPSPCTTRSILPAWPGILMTSPAEGCSWGSVTGWLEREHSNYSFDLLPLKQRFERFEEALQIITSLFRSDAPLSFAGRYYHLQDAVLLPRPQRKDGPHLVIGGRGLQPHTPAGGRLCNEWNIFRVSPQTLA